MTTDNTLDIHLTNSKLVEKVQQMAVESNRSLEEQVEFLLKTAIDFQRSVPDESTQEALGSDIEGASDELLAVLAVSVNGTEEEVEFYANLHKRPAGAVGLNEYGELVHVSHDGKTTILEEADEQFWIDGLCA